MSAPLSPQLMQQVNVLVTALSLPDQGQPSALAAEVARQFVQEANPSERLRTYLEGERRDTQTVLALAQAYQREALEGSAFSESGAPWDISIPEAHEAHVASFQEEADYHVLFDETKKYKGRWIERRQSEIFNEILTNPNLKTQFIAFMDAIASQESSDKIAELFRAYFPRHSIQETSGQIGRLLRMAWNPLVPDRALAFAVKRAILDMGGRFLAGQNVKEALKTIARYQKEGYDASLDIVREKVLSPEETVNYCGRVDELMDLWAKSYDGPPRTKQGVPVRHVSIKLSAMTHRFDPIAEEEVIKEVGEKLLKRFQKAKALSDKGKPILVNIDLEEEYVSELSYRVLWKALSDPSLAGWDDAGVVIQAYRKNSERDLMRMIHQARIHHKKIQVRIVKGAYHTYEQINAARKGWDVPLYLKQEETNANFEKLVRLATANNDVIRVATGSHNVRHASFGQSVSHSELAFAKGLTELQVLMGMGRAVAKANKKQGRRSRFYAPFGTLAEAIGYLVRRLSEVGPESAIGQMYVVGDADQYNPHGEPAMILSEKLFKLEPEPHFEDPEVRQKIADAIQTIEKKPHQVIIPMIAGETYSPAQNPDDWVINPANRHQALGTIYNATVTEVDRAVEKAQEGFRQWSAFTPKQRADVLRKAADLVMEKQYEIAAQAVLEIAKPWPSAMDESREAANFLRLYADQAEAEGAHYEARGVGVAISPFNFPFAITMGQIAAGLALGNAMLCKPAEQAPIIGKMVIDILRQAGVPKAAIQYLPGEGHVVGDRLVKHPDVDFIAFTGSKETAKIIIKNAADTPPRKGGSKLVVAETGGKNLIIIDETADLDVAIEAAIEAGFQFNGQRCSAASRIIFVNCSEKRKQDFLRRLTQAAQAMSFGDPRKPSTQLGVQIDQSSLEKARSYIDIGLQEGATLLYKKEVPAEMAVRGFYFGPVIFTDVKPESRLAQEEIFAPILAVMDAKDFDEAIQIANNSRYGLTAALISRHPDHVRRFLNEMDAGNRYVNRAPIGARPGEVPFSGIKDSGTGPAAGGSHQVVRFGKSRHVVNLTAPFPSPPEPYEMIHGDVSTSRSNVSLEDLRKRQKVWSKNPRKDKNYLLSKLLDSLSYRHLAPRSDNLAEKEELARAYRFLEMQQHHLNRYLTPQKTVVELPGQMNETIFDHPVGLGFIATEGEQWSFIMAAVAASLAMGNAVILEESEMATQVKKFFERADCGSTSLIQIRKASDVLRDMDYVVVRNRERQNKLYQSFVAQRFNDQLDFATAGYETPQGDQRGELRLSPLDTPLPKGNPAARPRGIVKNHPGFPRLMGADENPADPRWLTYFAHETRRIESTLRHGALLNVRPILEKPQEG